jgi:hypothetical protein
MRYLKVVQDTPLLLAGAVIFAGHKAAFERIIPGIRFENINKQDMRPCDVVYPCDLLSNDDDRIAGYDACSGDPIYR